MLHMVIEQTSKYPMRMQYDPDTGRFLESDHRSLAAVRGFTKPYGWIKESGTPPEPHWDCILMSDNCFDLGEVVEVRVIGLFKRNDFDHKYVVVECGRDAYDLQDLSQSELDELHRLYPKIRDGEGWFGKETALFCMEHHGKVC